MCSIEIDCYPYQTRPDIRFSEMCEILKLDREWFHEPGVDRGMWEWQVKAKFTPEYLEKQEAIVNFLRELYSKGHIKYASW